MSERVIDALQKAGNMLEESGLEPKTAEWVMRHVKNQSTAAMLASLRDSLTAEEASAFWEMVNQLLTGKPVQYVIGEETFYGYPFEVNEHVLIPRPETEELVYHALERSSKLFGNRPVQMADIGTGSGAIAVSFKKERPSAQVTATDISEEALAVAKRNAERNEAALTFKLGNLAEPLSGQTWDVILSNPPYIAWEELSDLAPTVSDFEPRTALFAEKDGLYCYQQLAQMLPQLMNKPALIGFEIGFQQGGAVQKLMQNAFPEAIVDILQDINGKDRMIFCEIT